MEQLRFNKNNRLANRLQSPAIPPSAQPGSSHQPAFPTPPTQSRDATVPSRFFPSTPSSFGNVLVPNSSPISSEGPAPKPYQPYGHSTRPESSSSSNLLYTNGWKQTRGNLASDPLSAPSGFISNDAPLHAPLRRNRNGDEGASHIEGPPRKKINRGTSNDAFLIPESPPSPDIQRVGQRRLGHSIGMDAMSISSDDSIPEPSQILAGPSKPRLMKTRPSASQEAPPLSDLPVQDKDFIAFRFMNPLETTIRIQAAWNQAGSNQTKAARFLADPTWSPSLPISPSFTESGHVGRIKEVDEVQKAQRVANKEKGKRSMIYANRPVLDTKIPATPPSAKNIIDLSVSVPATPVSPSTPAIKAPSRKRAKKLVIHSDSESAFEDSDDDANSSKFQQSQNTYELRALDYLNTSGSEALQELTGKQTIDSYWNGDSGVSFSSNQAVLQSKLQPL